MSESERVGWWVEEVQAQACAFRRVQADEGEEKCAEDIQVFRVAISLLYPF